MPDEGPSRQRSALVHAELPGAAYPAATDLPSPLGSLGGDGAGQVGMLGGEGQERHDGLGQPLAVDVLLPGPVGSSLGPAR